MSDELGAAIVIANADGTEADVICPCGFEGHVTLYDIGDGPEFNCPSCDWCWPQNPVVGEDGLTNAERTSLEVLEQYKKEHGWPSSTSST